MFYLGWTPVLLNHSFRAAPKTLITPQMHFPQDWFWPNVLFLSDLRECGKFIEKISQALDNIYFLVTFKLNLDNNRFLPHYMLCNKCINDCDWGRFQPNFPPGNNCNNLPGSFFFRTGAALSSIINGYFHSHKYFCDNGKWWWLVFPSISGIFVHFVICPPGQSGQSRAVT